MSTPLSIRYLFHFSNGNTKEIPITLDASTLELLERDAGFQKIFLFVHAADSHWFWGDDIRAVNIHVAGRNPSSAKKHLRKTS